MRWNIIVECVGEDGQRSTITLGTIERLAASTTAENLGVNLREPIRDNSPVLGGWRAFDAASQRTADRPPHGSALG
jgi:hypothetical protein